MTREEQMILMENSKEMNKLRRERCVQIFKEFFGWNCTIDLFLNGGHIMFKTKNLEQRLNQLLHELTEIPYVSMSTDRLKPFRENKVFTLEEIGIVITREDGLKRKLFME